MQILLNGSYFHPSLDSKSSLYTCTYAKNTSVEEMLPGRRRLHFVIPDCGLPWLCLRGAQNYLEVNVPRFLLQED